MPELALVCRWGMGDTRHRLSSPGLCTVWWVSDKGQGLRTENQQCHPLGLRHVTSGGRPPSPQPGAGTPSLGCDAQRGGTAAFRLAGAPVVGTSHGPQTCPRVPGWCRPFSASQSRRGRQGLRCRGRCRGQCRRESSH